MEHVSRYVIIHHLHQITNVRTGHRELSEIAVHEVQSAHAADQYAGVDSGHRAMRIGYSLLRFGADIPTQELVIHVSAGVADPLVVPVYSGARTSFATIPCSHRSPTRLVPNVVHIGQLIDCWTDARVGILKTEFGFF